MSFNSFTCEGFGCREVMESLVLDIADEGSIVLTQFMYLLESQQDVSITENGRATICDILEILLLLLHMKAINASQASWFKIRTPVKVGAFLRKFGSTSDHC